MRYEFPNIEHIDQVLPAIQNSQEFIVAERDGYKVINYMVSKETTFPEVYSVEDAIRRECRGLVFHPDGRINARRLHKFFNVGEREETSLIKMTEVFSRINHTVLDKLDGSMVTPMWVNGKIRWGTKMGITHLTPEIELFVEVNPQYQVFAETWMSNGYTPIFEYCSPTNKVVINYDQTHMTLIAIRDTKNGQYMDPKEMSVNTEGLNIPVVRSYGQKESIANLVSETRNMEGTEGFVVRFSDGHMAKIKTEWYVKIHRVKEVLLHPRHLFVLLYDNTIDDALALMDEEDKERANSLLSAFWKDISYQEGRLKVLYRIFYDRENPNKDFALSELADGVWDSVMHTMLREKSEDYCGKLLYELVGKKLPSNSKFDEFVEGNMPNLYAEIKRQKINTILNGNALQEKE